MANSSSPMDALLPDVATKEMQAQRLMALSQMLMQQGAQPDPNRMAGRYVVKTSPLEALNAALKPVLGAYYGNQGIEAAADANKTRAQQIGALINSPDPTNTAGTQPMTGPQALAAQSPRTGDDGQPLAPLPSPAAAQSVGAPGVNTSQGVLPQGSMSILGMPKNVAIALYLNSPQEFAKAQAAAYAQPDAVKQLGLAYGYGTPEYMKGLQALATKASYIEPTKVSQRDTILDPMTHQPIFTGPDQDHGIFTQWQNGQPVAGPIAGANPALAANAGAIKGAESAAALPSQIALSGVDAANKLRYSVPETKPGNTPLLSPQAAGVMGITGGPSPAPVAVPRPPVSTVPLPAPAMQAPPGSPQGAAMPPAAAPAAPPVAPGPQGAVQPPAQAAGTTFAQMPGGGYQGVNTAGPELAGQTTKQQAQSQQYADILKDATSAEQGLQQLQIMKANAPNGIFGTGADLRLDGLRTINPSSPSVKASEEIDKAAAALALAQGNRSDSQLSTAKDATPHRGLSQNGFLGNIDSTAQRFQRSIDMRDQANQWLTTHPNLDGFTEAFNASNPPSMYAARVTGQTGQPAAPGAPVQPTAPAAPIASPQDIVNELRKRGVVQ